MPVRLVEYFSTLSDFQLERRRLSALEDILLNAAFGSKSSAVDLTHCFSHSFLGEIFRISASGDEPPTLSFLLLERPTEVGRRSFSELELNAGSALATPSDPIDPDHQSP